MANRECEYVKSVLTDNLEIYIIELPKFNKYSNNLQNKELNLWINFINNPEVIDLKNTDNDEVKKAKKILDEISGDEHERYLAELREKYIRDQQAIQEAGYDKGLKQGKKNEKINIARKMLKDNISIDRIIYWSNKRRS